MELKQLRNFVAVAEEGGISAAARRLGLTQPALSRQIKALEEDLRVVLLDRGARSFALTPAAEALVADARKMLEFGDAMVRRVRSVASGLPLRIGYAPSLAGDFLPATIAGFRGEFPGVRVSLHEVSTVEMQRVLLEGGLDLIVTVPCAGGDLIDWTVVRECGWRLMVPTCHRLAEAGTVEPADLDGERLLIFDRHQYPDYWARVSAYCKEQRIKAVVADEYDGITSLTAAVEANLGIAIVAETSRSVAGESSRVRALRMRPEPAPLGIAVGTPGRHTPPPHVRAFVDEMKRHAAAKPAWS